jgi:hypothetical protein
MANWTDRSKAARAWNIPKPTSKEEAHVISVLEKERLDKARKGEKVVVGPMFDDKAIKGIKAKVKKQKAEVKVAEKKAKAEAVDYSKDFGNAEE